MPGEWTATSELLISYFLDELLILNLQIKNICLEEYFEKLENFHRKP